MNANIVTHTGFREHVTRDGRTVTLTLWQRHCRECDEAFEFASSTGGAIALDVKRTCVRCPSCRRG